MKAASGRGCVSPYPQLPPGVWSWESCCKYFWEQWLFVPGLQTSSALHGVSESARGSERVGREDTHRELGEAQAKVDGCPLTAPGADCPACGTSKAGSCRRLGSLPLPGSHRSFARSVMSPGVLGRPRDRQGWAEHTHACRWYVPSLSHREGPCPLEVQRSLAGLLGNQGRGGGGSRFSDEMG